MRILSKMFCAFLSAILLLSAVDAKKLVVVVGPHETHTHTTTFLSTYAAGDGSGSSSFDGWIWPFIENEKIDTSSKHVFDLLAKEQDDDEIEKIVSNGIKSAWASSEHGVFIGSLDFDKVGTNPYSGYDPVPRLARVVNEAGIPTEDVIVIVTYQIPRANQWGLVWKNHFDAESYDDFICSKEQSEKRWEWLDTSMNPFKVAKAYHDQKWKVVAIDQDSLIKTGKDVANVVACLAMENDNCEDWKVNGVEAIASSTSFDEGIDELSDRNRSDLERLFLFRDCYYFTQLQDSSSFELFAKNSGFNSLQSECKQSLQESYGQLSDTSFLMNAIQSQKYCETVDIDVPSFLAAMSEGETDGPITDDGVAQYEPTDDEVESFEDEANDNVNDNNSDQSPLPATDQYKSDSIPSSSDSYTKKLIVFVGPHETEAVDVTKFFANYASSIDDSESTNSFSGWNWPLFNDDIIWKPAHRAFDLLITEPDQEEVQKVLIDGISETWKNSKNGVIIGSLDFDWVGSNPYSRYDPIAALQRVVDALGIPDEDVAVVLTYRSPRIDHWSVVWNNHFESNSYEDFICSDGEESDKRWEWLDTVMNPFKIAKSYYDQGWKVAVIDQDGTINAGMDVSHTIACSLMKDVKCTDGWVDGLKDYVSDPLTVIPMESMDEDDRRNLEQLFRERDCYFKYELKDKPGFAILNQRSAWSSCSVQHQEFYQKFSDTNFMLNLLKSQKKCGKSNVDISNLLEKKMVHDDDKKLIVFAGPHETSAVPVTRFFVNHASDEAGANRSTSLGGWTWPIIQSEILGDTESHRTFDLLLSDADTRPVQNIIMDGIRDSWSDSQNGVIIGSLDLDRVGENPYSSYDALGAVDRVVQTLGVADQDVTVALNYRSKRIDHLSAVWWNHFDAETFQDFICSDDEADKRWEWLDTVMNPLKLAKAYIEQGWNVAMIDQEGTSVAGKDVAHSLACELMDDVDCENGWVRDLKSITIESPSSYEIDSLDDIQRTKLETLFRMRDCVFRSTLESDKKFSVVNRNELWKTCSKKDSEKFEKLANTDFFLKVMRSLQGCGDVNDLESSTFASELMKSGSTFNIGSHSTLIIVILFLTAVCMILFGLLMKERRRKRIKKAKEAPAEGIFRDNPNHIDVSYRDNESVEDDTAKEDIFYDAGDNNNQEEEDDDDESDGTEEEIVVETMGDENEVDNVETLNSDEELKIV